MQKVLIFKGGCDLTTNNPCLMKIQSCMARQYDAGICKHQKEHTGVIEIYEVLDERKNNDSRKSWGGCTQSRTVYHADGISPTLQAGMDHGNTVPYIVETKIMNRSADGTDSMQNGIDSPGNNVRIGSVQNGGVADLNYPDSKTRRGRVIENGEICPTLTTENIPNVIEDWIWEVDGNKYLIRIRKLTPRECWRLMDFSDEDFDKAQSVNSNTQLYKQAGNSIVKNIMCEVFKQLIER